MQPNTRHYNVLAPGPVNLHPDVEKILAAPMIHHRTPEFDAILKRVLSGLKDIFQTREACFISSSTGSGGMEALLINVLQAGDQVLAIDSGKFGERWAEMAAVYGAHVQTLKVDWGQAVEVSAVKDALTKNPKIRLVLCQACETSTGVTHPIQEIAALIRTMPDCLFLVDAITALGAFPLPMDEWGLDGVVGGSQKAFMLPTGLSFFAFSQKAWKVIEKNPTPRYYFDVRRERAANQKDETFFSSNVTLIRALDVVLELIAAKSLSGLFKEIETRAIFTRKFAQDLGLELYANPPSNSVTALKVPAGVDSQKLRADLEAKYAITIMGGQDQAKGKIIRIGHMGNIEPRQMIELMTALKDCLSALSPGYKPVRDWNEVTRDMEGFWKNV